MLHSAYKMSLAAALFGLLLVPSVSWGQRTVQDEAKLFKPETVTQVNATVAQIKQKHKKDLWIETVKEIPADVTDKSAWARSRFKNDGNGVYIVISDKPKHFEVVTGTKTRDSGLFTKADTDELVGILKRNLKDDRDGALTMAASHVLDKMNGHAQAKAPVVQPRQNAPAPVAVDQQPAWVAWVCTLLVVALVIWVVFAIIRAMSGAASGSGAGGGGFMTGLLGGLFGAMAGMWMYNTFFGGHAAYGSDNFNHGNTGTGMDNDAGAQGGGDWDDRSGKDGGGDKDAGGGDDAGGGGDWGGGDAGGDWGGGGDVGGGDFGGGGGDW